MNSTVTFKTVLTFLRGEGENGGSDLHLGAWQLHMQNGPPTEKKEGREEREKEGKTADTIVPSNWVKSVTQGEKKLLCSAYFAEEGCMKPALVPRERLDVGCEQPLTGRISCQSSFFRQRINDIT